MAENLNTALMLMGVGMITVFVVLSLVVVVGKLLISFINRFIPEELSGQDGSGTQDISSQKVAAITAAVEIVTGGKGKITGIEKLA